MAWNGIGTYVLPPAYSPEVNGTTIDATRYNGLTSDVATGITQTLNKNGENSPTANINWGGFKITNVAQAAAVGDALAWGKTAQLAGTGEIVRNTTTTARGNGQNFFTFYDPTGQKGYIGYGGTVDDNFNIANLLNSPIAFVTNSIERMRVMAGGAVVIGGTTNVGVGGGTDTFAVSAAGMGLGIAGSTTTAQINVQASGFFELVNRTAGGGVKIYTNAGGVVAAAFASNGDLTLVGNTTAKGVALCASKAALTSRASFASLTDDPDLIVALTPGRWAIRAWLDMPASGGTANAAGMQVRCAFSGTQTASPGVFISNENTFASVNNGVTDLMTGTNSGTKATGNFTYVTIEGSINVTVAGNFSIQWAQLVSQIATLTVAAGSYLICTKLT